MGTSKGVNRTLKDTPNIANRLAEGLFDGRVKIAYDSFTFAGEGAGEIVEMCPKIPLGAKIIDVILDTVDLTGGAQLKVGDYDDDARYIPFTDHGSAALVTRMSANDGRMYEIVETTPGAITTDRQIIITTQTAAATGLCKLLVLYTTD